MKSNRTIEKGFLPFLMNILPGNEMMPMEGVITKVMRAILTVLYLGFAILLLMPSLYLYGFSSKLKLSLMQSETEILDTSFQ